MTGIILAWLVGEGLMVANDVTVQKRPPLPAELLSTSGLFILLALLGEKAPQLASVLAWGFDLAAFMALWTNKAKNAKPTGGTAVGKGVQTTDRGITTTQHPVS